MIREIKFKEILDPVPEVVQELQELLDAAMAGDIRGVVCVALHASKETSSFYVGTLNLKVLGRHAQQAHALAGEFSSDV